MLDLTKSQIVEPPRKAWFRDNTDMEWCSGELYAIDHRSDYPYVSSHNKWSICTLKDPESARIKYVNITVKGKGNFAYTCEKCDVSRRGDGEILELFIEEVS